MQYIVATKEGEMIFNKDVGVVTKEHNHLVVTIAEHIGYDTEDAEIYVQWLKTLT